MSPEEKAKELIDKFQILTTNETIENRIRTAKNYSIICVDEILKLQVLRSTRLAAKLDRYSESDSAEYWQEVKEAIKNQ